MNNKLRRLSYNQLIILQYLLSRQGSVVTVAEIQKHTPLKQKALGGVLSSLSRTKFRGKSLIEPMGKALDGVGLRWKLNTDIIDVYQARKEVSSLLASYKI